ncbi:MAG: hypothetical protein GWP06_17165 [Actinobacteria bacterium]|nr:hypothetical protein [Actinomycetota bacterium]
MQKKILFTGLAVVAVLISFIFLFQNKNRDLSQPTGIKNNRDIQLVSIDKFVRQPGLYKGIVGVSGTVKSTSKSFFTLGCKDACIMMPVKYDQQSPKPGTRITAIGKLEKTKKGKYIFNATDIQIEK